MHAQKTNPAPTLLSGDLIIEWNLIGIDARSFGINVDETGPRSCTFLPLSQTKAAIRCTPIASALCILGKIVFVYCFQLFTGGRWGAVRKADCTFPMFLIVSLD